MPASGTPPGVIEQGKNNRSADRFEGATRQITKCCIKRIIKEFFKEEPHETQLIVHV